MLESFQKKKIVNRLTYRYVSVYIEAAKKKIKNIWMLESFQKKKQ